MFTNDDYQSSVNLSTFTQILIHQTKAAIFQSKQTEWMDPPMPQPEYTLNMINFPDNFRSKNVISHFHTYPEYKFDHPEYLRN